MQRVGLGDMLKRFLLTLHETKIHAFSIWHLFGTTLSHLKYLQLKFTLYLKLFWPGGGRVIQILPYLLFCASCCLYIFLNIDET